MGDRDIDLWLVVRQAVGLAAARRMAIGPWPSTARRAVAQAAWQRDPTTLGTELVTGRPLADQYLTPRIGAAGWRQVEARRHGATGGAGEHRGRERRRG